MKVLGSKFGSAVLWKFLTRIDKQCMLIFQEKWVIFRSSLPSMKIVVVYWCTYYREQSYREFLQQIIFDFCTMEMLMSKAKYYSEPAFLNNKSVASTRIQIRIFYLKPIQSWAWEVSTKESLVVYQPTVVWNCLCSEHFT